MSEKLPISARQSTWREKLAWLWLILMAVLIVMNLSTGVASFGKVNQHIYHRSTEPDKFWAVVAIKILCFVVVACILILTKPSDRILEGSSDKNPDEQKNA